MIRQRIITAIIGIPLLIAIIWFGEPWFTLLIVAMAGLGSFEFYRMVGALKIQPFTYLGMVSVILLVSIPHCPSPIATPFLLTSIITISLIWMLFRPQKEQSLSDCVWTLAGILYIGWMLSHWVSLRGLEFGKELVFWAMFTTFANDTSAFFIGRTWGRRHLAPAISPRKTWEGAFGGLLSSVIASVILRVMLTLPFNYWQTALLGAVISVFAQLGDLAESLLKRNTGCKDASNLIPGHGGMLDRLDSLIFTGVVVYYCVILFKLLSTL